MRYLTVFLITMLVLVGCGNRGLEEPHDKQSSAEDPEQEEVEEGNKTKELAEFKEIDIKVENNEVKIKGNANTTNGIVYYAVQQEDKEVHEEKKVILDDKNSWAPFTETFSTKEAPDQEGVVVIELYGKDEQEKRINPNYIPADLAEMK